MALSEAKANEISRLLNKVRKVNKDGVVTLKKGVAQQMKKKWRI